MKAGFFTLGCKVNQYETNKIKKDFKSFGFTICDSLEICDVYVINSCSVTAESDRKSRQLCRRARSLNSNAVVVMCGCSAEKILGNEASSIADIFVSNKDKKNIPQMVFSYFGIDMPKSIDPLPSFDKTRALIKIEDGCNNFCTYCIIPYLRGRVCSIPFDDVLAEATALAGSGFTEVVLTGIHITSYSDGDKTLIDILEAIEKIDGILRIRLGSLEPLYINEDIARRLSSLSKLCPHFHISLQSGSDTVLERMGRKYNTSQYNAEINLLMEYIKNVSITTDIITGFVGESEDEFIETVNFTKKIGFSKVHIFPYSKREGTAAFNMTPHLPKDIKKRRASILAEACRSSTESFLLSQIGNTVKVLFESITKDGLYFGYSENYTGVYVNSDVDIRSNILTVLITDKVDDGVFGVLQ